MKHGKNCTCCIVPPYIMDMPEYKEKFKYTVDFTERVRLHRKEISYQIVGPSIAGLNPPGNADRYIYDSKSTSKSAFHLVRQEGKAQVADPAANSVYDNAGKVRDFYKNTYNHFSVDNNGKDLIMNIHFQLNFNNALWSSQVDQMFFGDGDGQLLKNLTGPIDVIGHEMTHGVVEYTAGLVYQGQSGALNEHIADVFGTVIKQHYNGQNASNANWLIGEDVVGPGFKPKTGFPVALRSLKDPGSAFNGDPQPAHMSNYYQESGDNFGVHINSGILNRVFYLVSTGDGMSLPGLGTESAGALWFKSLTAIRVDTCDFAGFAAIVKISAKAMMRAKELPADTDVLLAEAFKSVGIV